MYRNNIKLLEKELSIIDTKIETIEKSGIFKDQTLEHLREDRFAILKNISDLHKKQYEFDNQYNTGRDNE
jgi:hypothetical protein